MARHEHPGGDEPETETMKLHEEELGATKTPQETQQVSGTVSREEARIEGSGDVDVKRQ